VWHVCCLVPLQVRHWADLAASAGQLLAQTLFARRPGVHVMHVTSEMVPVAKVRLAGGAVRLYRTCCSTAAVQLGAPAWICGGAAHAGSELLSLYTI
jgi:hypothetical protein